MVFQIKFHKCIVIKSGYMYLPVADLVVVFVYGYDTQNPPLVPAHTIVPRLQVSFSFVLLPPLEKVKTCSCEGVQVGDFGFARDEASIWAHSRPPALGPGPAATVGEFQARERRWRTRHDGKFMYYLPVRHPICIDTRVLLLIRRRISRNNSARTGI